MKLADYQLNTHDLHEECFMSKDGWWRFKDVWESDGEYSGNGESMFQNNYIQVDRNCFNLIFVL